MHLKQYPKIITYETYYNEMKHEMYFPYKYVVYVILK